MTHTREKEEADREIFTRDTVMLVLKHILVNKPRKQSSGARREQGATPLPTPNKGLIFSPVD